jgi:UDP-N-acetylmuramate: L-alanyl-gamma-D-glutamyl-meso-diaminopimelate ligase
MHLHFIAIGGAIMHQLAITSKKRGYQVSGSDDEIADPARTNLLQEGLLPVAEGWFPEKIRPDLDAVILGMHAQEDNPELLRARELNIPVYSFPEYIYEVSKNKLRVVIAGSHGKTTTTSMIMHVLRKQGMDFDYLVGARVAGFEHSVQLSNAPVIILEGDEYPASALEKRPKIHFYHPQLSVITGIAWDHVNVFPTYENYWEQFRIFVDQMPAESTLIYNAEDREVVRLVESEQKNLKTLPYATPRYDIRDNQVLLPTTEGNISLQIFGDHNLQNMEAARKVCNNLGVADREFYRAMATFNGAARRLEKIVERANFVAFRDFAHAPSKLKATLKAVRKRYPSHRLVACFELHTYSSLRSDFLNQYAHSMDECDAGAVFFSSEALQLKKLPRLQPEAVKAGFANANLALFEDPESLRNWIGDRIGSSSEPVCLLLMSSGVFGGMDIAF